MLRVITSMNPANGGPCQGIRNSVPALKALGVTSDVVSLDDPLDGFLKNDPFDIFALGKAQGPWAKNIALEEWLLKHLTNYDAVIVHGLWQYHVYAVRKAMNMLRNQKIGHLPKVYIMPHGMLDPYFQKAEGRKLKAIRNVIYWKLIESKNVNAADGLLFTCEEEMRLAALSFSPYHPKKTLNVSYGVQSPPGVETINQVDFFNRFGALKGKPFLLFLSRIHQKKGVDLLLDAYLEVYGDMENPPALVVAGPGMESDYGMRLKDKCQNNVFLKEHVVFTGMLQGDMKWTAFYNCEAFVLPSHQENFGIAVVEALACGKPVLISDKINIYKEIIGADAGISHDDNLSGVIRLLSDWKLMSDKDKTLMQVNAINAYTQLYKPEQAAKYFLKQLNVEAYA